MQMVQLTMSKTVVNKGSNYVWMAGFETVFTDVGAGTTGADSGEDFILSAPAIKTYKWLVRWH